MKIESGKFYFIKDEFFKYIHDKNLVFPDIIKIRDKLIQDEL